MNSPRRRSSDRPLRIRVMCLLALMPVAFVLGQCLGRAGSTTVREAEATPVPRALPDGIVKFHDASDEVTCWAATRGDQVQNYAGVSCMPDAWLASARIDDAQAVQP